MRRWCGRKARGVTSGEGEAERRSLMIGRLCGITIPRGSSEAHVVPPRHPHYQRKRTTCFSAAMLLPRSLALNTGAAANCPPVGFVSDPLRFDSSLVGSDRTSGLVRRRVLRRDRPFLLWIPTAAAPPPDSRHSVLEDSQRFDGNGRSQRARGRSLHHGRAHHRAPVLLLPHTGLGVQTTRQE